MKLYLFLYWPCVAVKGYTVYERIFPAYVKIFNFISKLFKMLKAVLAAAVAAPLCWKWNEANRWLIRGWKRKKGKSFTIQYNFPNKFNIISKTEFMTFEQAAANFNFHNFQIFLSQSQSQHLKHGGGNEVGDVVILFHSRLD